MSKQDFVDQEPRQIRLLTKTGFANTCTGYIYTTTGRELTCSTEPMFECGFKTFGETFESITLGFPVNQFRAIANAITSPDHHPTDISPAGTDLSQDARKVRNRGDSMFYRRRTRPSPNEVAKWNLVDGQNEFEFSVNKSTYL